MDFIKLLSGDSKFAQKGFSANKTNPDYLDFGSDTDLYGAAATGAGKENAPVSRALAHDHRGHPGAETHGHAQDRGGGHDHRRSGAPVEVAPTSPAPATQPPAEVAPTPAPATLPPAEVAPTPAPATQPPAEVAPTTPAPATPPPTEVAPTTVAPDTNTAAVDLAAAQSISAMPTNPDAMNTGATGDPVLPANTQNLGTLTINGDGDLSQLAAYGTLTNNADGTYTLDANGNQVPQLVLNNVNGLTIENAVFANVSGSAAVTINGDSSNDTVKDSTFNNIYAGVDVYQVNNVMPSGISIINNTFSSLTGSFPTASVIQFAGAGAAEIAASPGAINDVSHNTITEGPSLSDPSVVNAAIGPGGSGQDIISFYNTGVGANENVTNLVSSNHIDGGFISPDGTAEPNTAINFEISGNGVVANNLVQNQPYAGIANDGSPNVDYIGNYVDAGSGMAGALYTSAPENGITPTGSWTYNYASVAPQVPIDSGNSSEGWPTFYAPDGAPNDPGNTNSWD